MATRRDIAIGLAALASFHGRVARAATDNRVVSAALPALVLEIDNAFRRLPAIAFPIEDLTNARREIFVDADRKGVVHRAVIVQFETVKPGSTFRFRYPSRPPLVFGAETYRFGTFAYDELRAAAAEPAKEAALTRAHLKRLNLSPPRVWRVARLARVADPQGLSEVIIFYFENADALYPPGAIAGADEDGDADVDPATGEGLLQRLRAAVRVVSG